MVFSDQSGRTAVVRAPGERFRLSALIQAKLFDEEKIVSVCRLKDVHSGRGLPDRVGPVSPAVSGRTSDVAAQVAQVRPPPSRAAPSGRCGRV